MFISLDGDDYANGRTLGRASPGVLRARIRRVLALQKRQRYPQAVLSARVRDFARLVAKLAPGWLAEVRGIADGSGVAADDLLLINCLPPDFPELPQPSSNCTTFLRIGPKQNLLLKIRDELNQTQAFFIRRSNGLRCQVGQDIGSLGIAHGFNSQAVALANNTGSSTLRVGDRVALNDCQILRFLAERTTSVEDVPRLFERLLSHKAIGGAGMHRGSIFILCDREKGLIVECVADEFTSCLVERGTRVVSNHFLSARGRSWEASPADPNTLLRKQRMEELVRAGGGALALPDLFALTRDRQHAPHALCNDDREHFWMTLSAQLAVIRRDHPGLSVNHVCCGNTANAPFVPIPLATSASFLPLLNGDWYRAADRRYRRFGCGSHMLARLRRFEAQRDYTDRDPVAGYALLTGRPDQAAASTPRGHARTPGRSANPPGRRC